MIVKIAAIFALIAAAAAAPVSRATVNGILSSGAGFQSEGTTTAGAAADKDAGIASSSLEGVGSVLGMAGPGFATGAALASPSL